MKKFHCIQKLSLFTSGLVLLCLFVASFTFAQSKTFIGTAVNYRQAELNANFKHYDIFEFDVTELSKAIGKKDQFHFMLNLGDQFSWNLNIIYNDLRSSNYQEVAITESGFEILPKRRAITYQGFLNTNRDVGEVRLSINDQYIMGFVTQGIQKYFIEPLNHTLKNAPGNYYVVYKPEDVIQDGPLECGVRSVKKYQLQEDEEHDHQQGSANRMMVCKEVDFLTAATFDMVSQFGSVQAVNDRIQTITNIMEPYYAFAMIDYVIVQQFAPASNGADPFTASIVAGDLLNSIESWAGGGGISTHDIGQLWVNRDIVGCNGDDPDTNTSLIGCANIGVVCNSNRYNVCEDIQNINCNAILSAHELGHNWDARHDDADGNDNNIMFPSLDCGDPPTAFGATEQGVINAHVNSRGCLSDCGTPANDECANATTLGCGDNNSSTTMNATATGSIPICTGGGLPNAGVWYRFVGTGDIVTVSLAGSAFDTQLNIYTGGCGSLICVDGDDDSGPGTTSEITFCSVNGTVYRIYLDGFGGATGTYLISISCEPDTEDPTINCPSGFSQNNDPGACGAIVNFAAPSTSDNCSVDVVEAHYRTVDNGNNPTSSYSNFVLNPNGFYEVGRYELEWRVMDPSGNDEFCSLFFEIVDNENPTIACPSNVTIECDEDPSSANTGVATATDNCTVPGNIIIGETEISTQGISGCELYRYTITRTWTARDVFGNSDQCMQTIWVDDTTPPVITFCPPGNDNLQCISDIPDADPASVIATDNCSAVDASLHDTATEGTGCFDDPYVLIYTYEVTDACGNTARCDQQFTATNTTIPVITSILPTCYKYCAEMINPQPEDVTYTVSCDFDAEVLITLENINGPENCPNTVHTYKYVVKDECGLESLPAYRDFIIKNDGPKIICAPFNLILECGDPNNQDYIDAHLDLVSATTSCDLGVDIDYYPFDLDLNSCGAAAVVTFKATDACRRTATCATTIAIQDNTSPTFTSVPPNICDVTNCLADVDYWYNHWINYMENGLAAEDACDSNVNIAAIDIPVNTDCPDGIAETVVTFVATDNCGNTATITGTFIVEASQSNVNLLGYIATELSETVETVSVTLEGNNNVMEMFETTVDGFYGFDNLTINQNYSVTPYLNEDPLNGVSSFDLILITKHILMLEELDSPYKMIAADINRSGKVTTADLVELRKLILQIDDNFQNNTSWRFVMSDFIFPEPNNPFASLFPEIVNINGLTENEQHDFVAVKVGDVNASAEPNGFTNADGRNFIDELVFSIADQPLKAGETYSITFRSDNFDAIHGYQFSLNFDQVALEFESVKTGELSNLNESNFGLTLLEKGVITTSWTDQVAQSVAKNTEVFHVSFTAKADVKLSEVIQVTSQYTKAEAYDGNLELMDVQLRFEEGTEVVTNKFRLYQNTPNPFKQETLIGFELPEKH